MKNKKAFKISLLFLFIVSSILLTGCSPEAKLKSAFARQRDIISYDSESQISLEINDRDINEPYASLIKSMKDVFNGTEITISNLYASNSKESNKKTDFSMKYNKQHEENLDVIINNFAFELWTNKNKEEDNKNITQILRFPLFVGNKLDNKKYLYMDHNKIYEFLKKNDIIDVDFNDKIQDWTQKSQPKLNDVLVQYFLNIDLNVEEVDKESRIYKLSFSDEEVKDLVRNFYEYLFNNEDFVEILNEYVEIVNSNLTDDKDAISFEGIKEMVNENIDNITNMQLLGEEGIEMEFVISKFGFITSVKTKIDILINLKEFFISEDKEDQGIKNEINLFDNLEATGIVNIKLKSYTSINNINSSKIKIEQPNINKENSISILDFFTINNNI